MHVKLPGYGAAEQLDDSGCPRNQIRRLQRTSGGLSLSLLSISLHKERFESRLPETGEAFTS
ncbi:hypothetical protein HPP92_017532 [Vanilla planifolia]|uniref:Uncharacterized protein n=1 Tax=Vanilla planifolia TaxID=51239 RepID=A0A835UM09_VANPL|nr:hypothetical protein HPP92_017532 [Vanilla planifolia]